MSAEALPLEGRTAVVVGGGSGIGLETARALGLNGANVIVAARSSRRLEAADAMIRSEGIQGSVVPFDALDYRDEAKFDGGIWKIKKLAGEDGVTDVQYFAGVLRDKAFDELTEEDRRVVMGTKYNGARAVVGAFSPEFLEAKSGSFLLTGSIAGIHGNAGQTEYSAANAAVMGFVRAAAQEFRLRRVRMNGLFPGLAATEIIEGMTDRQMQRFLSQTMGGRALAGAEVAEAAVAITVDEKMNGAIVVVDDGFTATSELAGGGFTYYQPGIGFVETSALAAMTHKAIAARKSA
jgi:3-oxoacyl-[acyl-carrier protein] reductase